MKRVLAGLMTAMILVVVIWLNRGRTPPSTLTGTATPEDCIANMFDAAAQGDVAAYLNCFSGDERERIERELRSQSPDRFGDSLIEGVRRLKGRAIYASSPPEPTSLSAVYTIERVYESRTDRQEVQMVRERGGWKITQVRAAQPIQPAVPYGTPVFELPDSPE
jgi:hypothetical protein